MVNRNKAMMGEAKPPAKEKTLSVEDGVVVTTDSLMEDLFKQRTWKYMLLLLSLPFTALAGPLSVYVASFAGSFHGKY